MKKTKLILTSLILALTLTLGGGFGSNAYAMADDPQGTGGSSKAQPAPEQSTNSMDAVRWFFLEYFGWVI